MKRPRATVTVRVVLEVGVDAEWGDDCTVGQVRDQGCREAMAKVRRAIDASNGRFRFVSAEVGELTVKEVG